MAQPHAIAVEYNPLPTGIRVHNSDAQVKAICGPVGGGKTSIACWEYQYLFREADEPYRTAILRESYRQLHDSTRRTWEEWFGPVTRYVKSDETLFVTLPNYAGIEMTHEIHLRHARRPEEASNLLSTEYAAIWLEEVVPAFTPGRGDRPAVIGAGLSKEIMDVAATRLRQKAAHRTLLMLTFNPPPRQHWAYKEFWRDPEDMRALGFELFKQPARENKKNLPPGYYEDMTRRLDPELAQRFVEGEPVTLYPGVRVFPEIVESVHVRPRLEVIPGLDLVIGFDFGLTPVAVICQIATGGRLRCLKEIQLFNAGAKRLGVELANELKGERWRATQGWRCWGDPAGVTRAQSDESTAFQVLAAAGFEIRPGAVDFESRKQAVRDRAQTLVDGEPALLIDSENCPMLFEGLLGGYRYPKSGMNISPLPQKNQFSHTADALQYLCTGEFSVIDSRRLSQSKAEEMRAKRQKHDPLSPSQHPSRTGWMGQ